MRAVLVTFVVAASGSGGGSGCGAPAAVSFSGADKASISKILDDQSAAWNRGDLLSFMAGYLRGPDLIFTSGAKVRRGWDETLARFEKRYGGSPEGMGTLRLEILELRPIGANGAVVMGRYTLSETENASSGLFTLVFERRAEGWRIVHDHTSADVAEAALEDK